MKRYTKETGLMGEGEQTRYLWTDAFAVCNFLGLYRFSKQSVDLDMALKLIEQVHLHLGKHREDDDRSGWLGSAKHPTRNGLRIGKTLPERQKGDPYDHVLEWKRDGQYFHYLTKWMFALNRTFELTGEKRYLKLSRDLATASMRFVNNHQKMYWKMSIDLSYALVDTMGKHDPLDGYITFLEISHLQDKKDQKLVNMTEKMYDLITDVDLRTTDSLGLGSLLIDYYRLNKLDPNHNLLDKMCSNIEWGLKHTQLEYFLAFRELGLSLGLYGAEKLGKFTDFHYLRKDIHDYWVEKHDFDEHRQINTVMLASSLHPHGIFGD